MEQVPAGTQLEGSLLVGQQKAVLQVPDGSSVTEIRPYLDGRMRKLHKK